MCSRGEVMLKACLKLARFQMGCARACGAWSLLASEKAQRRLSVGTECKGFRRAEGKWRGECGCICWLSMGCEWGWVE